MDELRRRFDEQGFVVLPKFFDSDEVRRLTEEVLTAQTRLSQSTLNRSRLVFREFLYPLSPYLQSVIASPRVVELMSRVIGPGLWVRRDTAIIKKPGGEEFPWHQDNGYNQLLDGYVQFWIALTPMHDDNGGVWVIPGSHKQGLLAHHMEGTHFVWDGTPKDPICVEAAAGDLLLFSSYLLHRTGPNLTRDDRIAYLVEFMDRKYFDPYTRPPFFMVSRNGRPEPKFVRFYEGTRSVSNQLKYVVPRSRRRIQILRGQLKKLGMENIHSKAE